MQIVVATKSEERSAELHELLRRAHMRDVQRARSLEEAISVLSRDSIVLLDWDGDGDGDGDESWRNFVTAVKEKFPYHDHSFVVLTSEDASSIHVHDLPAEVEVVQRPIDPADVTQRLERLARPFGDPVKLDVNHVNPFIRATVRTLEALTGLRIERKDLFLKRDYRMFGDISGVMGLSGTASGSVILSFPANIAVRLVGRMIKRELTGGVDHLVRDGVGEIVNVIAGNAKAAFANTPFHFNISLPSVVSGAGHMITHKTGTPCIVVVFAVDGGELALQLCLAPGESA